MRLKELRIANGLTREQLSKEIGMTVRSLGRWENGETDIMLKTAVKLAKYFDVSLDEFVRGNNEWKYSRVGFS